MSRSIVVGSVFTTTRTGRIRGDSNDNDDHETESEAAEGCTSEEIEIELQEIKGNGDGDNDNDDDNDKNGNGKNGNDRENEDNSEETPVHSNNEDGNMNINTDDENEAEEEQRRQKEEEEEEEEEEALRVPPLSSSSRLQGYFALSFLSCLAFVAAYESDGNHRLTDFYPDYLKSDGSSSSNGQSLFQLFTALPANSSGRYYAMVVSGVSAVSNIIITILHCLDFHFNFGCCGCALHEIRFFQPVFRPLRTIFAPGSYVECTILTFGMIWWCAAVAIITSIRGPAGDGRGQFNLYFSTWLCLFVQISMLELWLISAGYSGIMASIASWPNQAPGWIMIFTCTAANLLCILDLYQKHGEVMDIAPHIAIKYESINGAQWAWLIFVCCTSFTTALGFSIVELFRRGSTSEVLHSNTSNGVTVGSGVSSGGSGGKSNCESQCEGICLAFLVIIWLPSVVLATTDGAASDFGNTYFFTWGSSVVVIQTFISWLQDWRNSVHEASRQLRLEYEEHKRIVGRSNGDEGEDGEDGENDRGEDVEGGAIKNNLDNIRFDDISENDSSHEDFEL